jgi:hypothetical protein
MAAETTGRTRHVQPSALSAHTDPIPTSLRPRIPTRPATDVLGTGTTPRRSRIAHAQGQIKTATARRPHSLVASSPDFPKPDNTPVASQLLATLLRADPCQIIGIVGGTINAQTSDRRPDPAPPYRMSTHAGSEQPVVDRGVALNRLLPSPQPSLL